MGQWSDEFLSSGGNQPEKIRTGTKWSEDFLSPQPEVQRTFTPTEEVSTITGQPIKEFTPTGQEPTGFGTLVKTGFVDDPQTKINIFAKARGISPDRYSIINGEIVYRGDDNKLYPETQDTPGAKLKRFAGETIAHTPGIVLGTVGAIAGPGTAAFGAAGGEGIRKSIGAAFLKEPQTVKGNIASIAIMGAVGGMSEVGGRLVTRAINRVGAIPGGKLAKAAGPLRGDIDIAKVTLVRKTGEKFGIDSLSAAETSANRSLVNWYNLLGDLDPTAEAVRIDRLKRVGQIDKSVRERFLPEVISTSKKTQLQTSEELVKLAKESILKPIKVRRAKASPLYKKAFEKAPPINTKPIQAGMNDIFAEALEGSAEQRTFQRLSKMLPEENASLRQIDKFKKEIDKILGDPTKDPLFAVDKDIKRQLTKFKQAMLKRVDEISPEYAKARRIFSEFSEEVERQGKKTLLGRVSKLEGDQQVKAARTLFTSADSTAETVLKAKKQMNNPEVWNKAVKDHLLAEFDKISNLATDDITNIGGMFQKKVFGTPHRRSILKAALDKRQFKALENYMEVLRRTGLIMRKESATASRQAMLSQAEGITGKIIRAETRPLVTKKRLIGDFIRARNSARSLRKMLEQLQSEKAIIQLEKMVQLDPRNERFIQLFVTFAGITAGTRAKTKGVRLVRTALFNRNAKLEKPGKIKGR